jgi:hypothetical protein
MINDTIINSALTICRQVWGPSVNWNGRAFEMEVTGPWPYMTEVANMAEDRQRSRVLLVDVTGDRDVVIRTIQA